MNFANFGLRAAVITALMGLPAFAYVFQLVTGVGSGEIPDWQIIGWFLGAGGAGIAGATDYAMRAFGKPTPSDVEYTEAIGFNLPPSAWEADEDKKPLGY